MLLAADTPFRPNAIKVDKLDNDNAVLEWARYVSLSVVNILAMVVMLREP